MKPVGSFLFLFLLCWFSLATEFSFDWSCLGRVPVVCEWEHTHVGSVVTPLSATQQTNLNLSLSFQQKGKIEKAEKLFQKLLRETTHPEVLVHYGMFVEQAHEDFSEALHYYIYSLHQQSDYYLAKSRYIFAYDKVIEFEKQLFAKLDEKIKWLSSIDIHKNTAAVSQIHALQQRIRLEYIYHTNALEGNSIPLQITQTILDSGLTPSQQSFHLYEINEVWGSMEAYDYTADLALEMFQFSQLQLESGEENHSLIATVHEELIKVREISWISSRTHPPPLENSFWYKQELNSNPSILQILQIHKKVLGRVMPDEAGQFRIRDISVGGYDPPPFSDVPYLMEEFESWLQSTHISSSLHPIERAALAHFQLTWIHPFQDGNGRTARMLMNLILMASGYPPILIKVEDKPLYYKVLRTAEESGDTRPFIYFIYQISERSLHEYLDWLQDFVPERQIDPPEVQFDDIIV